MDDPGTDPDPATDPPETPPAKRRRTKEPATAEPASASNDDFLKQIDDRVGETVHKILDERVAPEPKTSPAKTEPATDPAAPTDVPPDKPSFADRLLKW